MRKLIKPARLRPGDKAAAVSLSWGAAGEPDIRWRYELGKKRMEEEFGLRVVEMPHTLAPAKYVSDHPEARAADLMEAFSDKSIRAVFNVIGGSDSIRMLPFLDFSVLRDNPKIFTGYSDGTVTDFFCLHAGLASFYGAHVLNDFGEPGQMHPYTRRMVKRMLFDPSPVGDIETCGMVSRSELPWSEKAQPARRYFVPDTGYRPLRGGVAEGRLLGGCFEVFPDVWELFPPPEEWENVIFFFEVCGTPTEERYRARLRKYGEMGILQRISGLLMGKPLGGPAAERLYDRVTLEVLEEYGRGDLPVLSNASFGHNCPSGIIPMGALARIDCERGAFSILENTVK